jgi:hypothetical protein
MKKKLNRERYDTPRDGATRWTIIAEKQYVNFLKAYAKANNVKITTIIGDCFEHWIKRLKSGKQTY